MSYERQFLRAVVIWFALLFLVGAVLWFAGDPGIHAAWGR